MVFSLLGNASKLLLLSHGCPIDDRRFQVTCFPKIIFVKQGFMAGATGFEPVACGFGDRRSTN